MLKGKRFFVWEIIPVVQAANRIACGSFVSSLDDDESNSLARSVCGNTALLLVDLNKQFDADTAPGVEKAPTYGELSVLWQRVESALAKLDGNTDIEAMVATLPTDTLSIPGPTWITPALVIGGLLGSLGLGYYWLRKS